MFLKTLKLTNFRNYSILDFKFKSPITVLVGDNAQGKTNFLESIYFLASSKSPKAARDEELIKSGEDVLRIEGVIASHSEAIPNNVIAKQKASHQRLIPVNDYASGIKKAQNLDSTSHVPLNDKKVSKVVNDETTTLEIAMQLIPEENAESSVKKRIKVNGIPRRVTDYTTNLAVVYFAPEDINLVTGSPSLRRYHIDSVLSQVDKTYKKSLSSYEDIVIRKNRVLKGILEGINKPDELIFWSEQQILFGEIIQEKRTIFFEFLSETEKKFGDFKFEYLPSLISKERLSEYQSREMASASSLIGPHRDDFCFLLSSHDTRGTRDTFDTSLLDLSKYGSRAQQRTAVLDLKISELNFMETKLKDRPLLLLDDIFSELDFSHRQHVLDLIKHQQTIITSVDLDKYLVKHLDNAQIVKVENGELI